MRSKLVTYIITMAKTAWYGWRVGKISKRYIIAATPSDTTFRIWGVIYYRLFLFTLLPPFYDAQFNKSMALNVEWLKLWTNEDLKGASKTIKHLSIVNDAMVSRCDGKGYGYHQETLDIYATWVGLAKLLNAWIVRVHISGEYDRSREDVNRVLCSQNMSRSGVRYTIEWYKRGMR